MTGRGKATRRWVIGAGVVMACALGVAGAGAALGADGAPRPLPAHGINDAGDTYGSAADAVSPETEPDLIAAEAANGRVGYVRKAELDEANGSTAAESFTSPEDALRWQESEGAEDRWVNVYELDGSTVIGAFLIAGAHA